MHQHNIHIFEICIHIYIYIDIKLTYMHCFSDNVCIYIYTPKNRNKECFLCVSIIHIAHTAVISIPTLFSLGSMMWRRWKPVWRRRRTGTWLCVIMVLSHERGSWTICVGSFANRLNQHRFKPTREFTNANSPCISTSPKWPLWTFQKIELKVRRSDVLHWIPHLGWWILTFRGFSNQFRQIIVKSNFVGS